MLIPTTILTAVARFPYVMLQDQKAQNTGGGTFNSGAWQTRTLNTEVNDADGICSLSTNQITLAEGVYECRISAPAWSVNRHQARLRNVTDNADVLIGTSEYTTSTGQPAVTRSIIQGRFTIAASKALEVQHQCQTGQASEGFGVPANFTTEVFTVAEFWKVA